MGKNPNSKKGVAIDKTIVIRDKVINSKTPKTPKPNESIVKQPKTK